jgi:hypothetical protein
MRRTGANARFRESSRFKCSEAAVRIRPFGARQRKSRLTVSRLTWSYVVSGNAEICTPIARGRWRFAKGHIL